MDERAAIVFGIVLSIIALVCSILALVMVLVA